MLVVQADDYNQNAPTIIAAAVTSVIKKRYLPSHIILGKRAAILEKEMTGIGRGKIRELMKRKDCNFMTTDGYQVYVIIDKFVEFLNSRNEI